MANFASHRYVCSESNPWQFANCHIENHARTMPAYAVLELQRVIDPAWRPWLKKCKEFRHPKARSEFDLTSTIGKTAFPINCFARYGGVCRRSGPTVKIFDRFRARARSGKGGTVHSMRRTARQSDRYQLGLEPDADAVAAAAGRARRGGAWRLDLPACRP
jgi:hypothetical protein